MHFVTVTLLLCEYLVCQYWQLTSELGNGSTHLPLSGWLHHAVALGDSAYRQGSFFT